MRILRAAAALLAAAGVAPAAAQSGWTQLGERAVGDNGDRDTIPASDRGEFRQMMICVDEAPVRFNDLVIRYRNGGVQDVRLRRLVPAGACTSDINLRGDERNIEAVDFTYESASLSRGRARVGLLAR